MNCEKCGYYGCLSGVYDADGRMWAVCKNCAEEMRQAKESRYTCSDPARDFGEEEDFDDDDE